MHIATMMDNAFVRQTFMAINVHYNVDPTRNQTPTRLPASALTITLEPTVLYSAFQSLLVMAMAPAMIKDSVCATRQAPSGLEATLEIDAKH